MKLSELVLLKNQLNELSFSSLRTDLNSMLDNLSYITKDSNYSTVSDQYALFQALITFNQTLENLKSHWENEVEKLKKELRRIGILR